MLDEARWTAVTLPHAFNETQAFAGDVYQLAKGVTSDSKHVRLPADASHGRALLEFQGVRRAADDRARRDRKVHVERVEVESDKTAASVGADVVPAGWRLKLMEADILGPLGQPGR